MPLLSDRIKEYVRERASATPLEWSGENRISVNEAVGAVAFYYEKIRNIVDYKDEHLIRQNAIRRIIGRRLILENSREDLAIGLLKELVRYRYFPNNALPQKLAKGIESILSLYFGVIEALSASHELTSRDQDWLLSMAACAIDEYLAPMGEERAMVRLMYACLEPTIGGRAAAVQEEMRQLQALVACHRILLRPDVDRLRFFLLGHLFSEWLRYDTYDIAALARDYRRVTRTIDVVIRHPLNKKLLGSFRRYRIPFIVLFTLVRSGKQELLENPDELEKEVRRVCENFYAMQKKRLYGRTLRAFLYIFLTKMVLGFAIELPYDLLTIHRINTLPLLVNVLFPPVFLAILTLSVRIPGKNNTDMIVQAVKEIVYPDATKEVFVPHRYSARKKSAVTSFVFTVLYLALFGVSFGAIGFALHALQFNAVSAVIFFVFFCLISFFGINLRRSVLDLVILKPRTNLVMTLLESFFLPIVSVGRWLSFNISRVNIFVFIFDVAIELPLQALIEITEEWFAFLKEKQEQLEDGQ